MWLCKLRLNVDDDDIGDYRCMMVDMYISHVSFKLINDGNFEICIKNMG